MLSLMFILVERTLQIEADRIMGGRSLFRRWNPVSLQRLPSNHPCRIVKNPSSPTQRTYKGGVKSQGEQRTTLGLSEQQQIRGSWLGGSVLLTANGSRGNTIAAGYRATRSWHKDGCNVKLHPTTNAADLFA